jgi:hypothetical protein
MQRAIRGDRQAHPQAANSAGAAENIARFQKP